MTEVSKANFGLLIAYLLPGLVALAGLSDYSATVRSWLGTSSANAPTIGGFLYGTLASVAAGITVSAIRWLLIDPLHHVTGIPEPKWNFAALQRNLAAFEGVVDNHYRYYQAYSNLLVAMVVFLLAKRPAWASLFARPGAFPLMTFALMGLSFVASRDGLRKYYARSTAILEADHERERKRAMTNGWHHDKAQPQKQGTSDKASAKPTRRAARREKTKGAAQAAKK